MAIGIHILKNAQREIEHCALLDTEPVGHERVPKHPGILRFLIQKPQFTQLVPYLFSDTPEGIITWRQQWLVPSALGYVRPQLESQLYNFIGG